MLMSDSNSSSVSSLSSPVGIGDVSDGQNQQLPLFRFHVGHRDVDTYQLVLAAARDQHQLILEFAKSACLRPSCHHSRTH